MRRLVLSLLIALAPGIAAAQPAGVAAPGGPPGGISPGGPPGRIPPAGISPGTGPSQGVSPSGSPLQASPPQVRRPPGAQLPGVQSQGAQSPGLQPPGGQRPGAQSAGRRPATGKAAERAALLDALQAAPDETFAVHVETRLRQMWLEAGSPAVTLLMSRGVRALNAGQSDDAIEAFTDALTLDPDLAAAYHQRALARFHAGDTQGAIRDIEETLKREPRDFAALRSLSEIAASREDWKGAYAAWQKMLEIDPKTPGGGDKLRDLKRRAFGEEA